MINFFRRINLDFYSPKGQWCLGIHSCNSTLMFEVPGAALSFYFGPYDG